MNWKFACAAAALMAAGAAPAAAQLSEAVAVIVNDDVISTYDVRQRASLLVISSGLSNTPEIMQRASQQALRDLVDERLQLQEAETFEIDITGDEIDRRIADIARANNTTVEGLEQNLAQSGISLRTLRAQIEADVAWNRLMRGLYGSRLRVSDNEVRETMERIAAGATRPQYLISEIFLPAESEQEFTDAEGGAMRLLEEMQRGASFPLVARQFSAAPSAAAGGDIGWIASTELAAELQPIAERLEAGQVSLPVRTPTGVYILAMRDRRAGAAEGSSTQVTLRQISAPLAQAAELGSAARRINGCASIDASISELEGATTQDLGTTAESDLSPEIRERVNNVAIGSASTVQESGDQANALVVCARQTGGGAVPTREEVESRLFEQELAMLSERYLRNLRREATIISR
ncbi:MAG: peptidylprolyl isomerase [Hyphomonadaceae bacterium]